MVVDGGGHFSNAGVSFVYTHHLYYHCPIQHMTVPWVIQENTIQQHAHSKNYNQSNT